jgi:hypothetical protein
MPAIHAVDKIHQGQGDSSVMYIPACPVTEANTHYVQRQRQDFLAGSPPSDFPGGRGETDHVGRATEEHLKEWADANGLRSFGFARWNSQEENLNQGQRWVLEKSNEVLGF